MSVHYKFKSALGFDTVTFDGLHISVRDLKKAILHQKRIGKNTDFDLQITNAQTEEVYCDDGVLIPKNTSLIVARIPLTTQQKKAWDRAESSQQLSGIPKGLQGDVSSDTQDPGVHRLAKAVDLSSLDASEEDKIQAMMTQSTQDYNPSNYMKIRGANQMGEVPSNYRCYKCHQPGHWIKNCPLGTNTEPIEIKKSTGIPRSFMVPVEGPLVPGAMMTPTGQFAVPAIDHQAYKEGKKERPPFQQEPEPIVPKMEIPDDLQCTVCKDLLTDAVMIPCCGNSFCDECIRTVLLDSEDHECPDCKEKDVSPDTLIPNRFLRNAVNNFKNATGYNKVAPRHPPRMSSGPQPGPTPHQVSVEPVQAVPVIGTPGSVQPSEYGSVSQDSPRESVIPQVIASSGTLVHVQTTTIVTNTIPVLGAPKVLGHVQEGNNMQVIANSTGPPQVLTPHIHHQEQGDPIPSHVHIHGPSLRKGIPIQRPDSGTLLEVGPSMARSEPRGPADVGSQSTQAVHRPGHRQVPPVHQEPPMSHGHPLEVAAVTPVVLQGGSGPSIPIQSSIGPPIGNGGPAPHQVHEHPAHHPTVAAHTVPQQVPSTHIPGPPQHQAAPGFPPGKHR